MAKGLPKAMVRKSNDNTMVDSANVFGGSRTHKLLRNEGLSRSSHSHIDNRGGAKGMTNTNGKDRPLKLSKSSSVCLTKEKLLSPYGV
jgi:hypothetical protein